VQRFARIILIVLGGLSIFAAAVLLGMNLYVQSQGTQARIRQELSRRLGTRLHIQRTSVTPWGGLTLTGITIPQPPGGTEEAANFLEAKSFGLRVALLSLFSRRLVVTNVSLIDPKVTWLQDQDGKWKLPGAEEEKQESAGPEKAKPTVAAEQSPEPGPGSATEAVPSATPGPVPIASPRAGTGKFTLVPDVRHVKLAGGDFRFLDRSGHLVAAFEKVGFRSSVRDSVDLDGRVMIGRISLRDRFFLERLTSPLRYRPGQLEFSNISAHADDGDVMGRFSMEPLTKDSPFKVEVKFRNIPADRVIAEAGGPREVIRGRIEGGLHAAGKAADPNALVGNGEIVLRDGEVRQYSLLVALGEILQIDELKQLHLEQAEAKYHINPGVVTVDELVLRSRNIQLSATGTVSFSGRLHLDSRLAIDEKIRDRLFKPVRVNFRPIDKPGYFAIDFHVRGTLDRPKSDLLKKVVGHELEDLISRFWSGSKKQSKKKESELISPTESPSASPSPASSPAGPRTEGAVTPGVSP
jgi:AsmA-like C-terminal region/AsmA family